MTGTDQKCGMVAIMGLPNAGKSTLVNALVGAKVSIVSKKAQTTRCRILGIAMHEHAQIVLMDTPGVFSPQKILERAMMGAAWEAMNEADIVIHLVDCLKKNAVAQNRQILEKLPQNQPCLLVLNKVDQIKKPDLLDMAQEFNESFNYAGTFMVSALKTSGLDDLKADLAARMPDAPWMFDEDQITDLPMRFMAAEIVREKVFHQLHEELPYAVMVETESWEKFDNGSVKIHQIIYVQRDSQKAIVLGKGGSRIKAIGEAARLELEEFMGGRVHLKLFVKVQENWPDRPENFPLIGLHAQS
jgi:GTP-binding protein Era